MFPLTSPSDWCTFFGHYFNVCFQCGRHGCYCFTHQYAFTLAYVFTVLFVRKEQREKAVCKALCYDIKTNNVDDNKMLIFPLFLFIMVVS